MNTFLHRLSTLNVGDVMSDHVITIHPEQPMEAAAELMAAHDVSGLVVVNRGGRCIGVISSTDFVKHQGRPDPAGVDSSPAERECSGPMLDEERACEIVSAIANSVGEYMSEGVQGIAPDKPVLEAARIMEAQHIHRLPVLADDGRLLGVITATDILAMLVKCADELRLASS